MKKGQKIVLWILVVVALAALLYVPAMNVNFSPPGRDRLQTLDISVLIKECDTTQWTCDGDDRVLRNEKCNVVERFSCGDEEICQEGECVSDPQCEPETCATLGDYECGSYDDGCGGTLECGSCSGELECQIGTCTYVGPISINNTYAEVYEPINITLNGYADALLVTWTVKPGSASGSGRSFVRTFSSPNNYTVNFKVIKTTGTINVSRNFTVYSNFQLLKTVAFPDTTQPQGLAVTNGAAWVVGRAGIQGFRLTTFDVDPVSSASMLVNMPFSGAPTHVVANNDIVAISDSSFGIIYIYDANHPESPSLLSTYSTYSEEEGSKPLGAVIKGDYLYVVIKDGTPGILVLDISDPSHPTRVMVWSDPAVTVRDIWMHPDENTIIIDSYKKVRFLDISSPLSPNLIGAPVPTQGATILGVGVDGDSLFTRDYIGSGGNFTGIEIFNISDSNAPVLLNNLSSTVNNDGFGDMVVDGQNNRLYTTHGTSYIGKYNVNNPANPFLMGQIGCSNFALQMDDGLIYATCSSGLSIFRP